MGHALWLKIVVFGLVILYCFMAECLCFGRTYFSVYFNPEDEANMLFVLKCAEVSEMFSATKIELVVMVTNPVDKRLVDLDNSRGAVDSEGQGSLR